AMKASIVLLWSVLVFASLDTAFSQSRRVSPSKPNERTNQRPVQPTASPTPPVENKNEPEVVAEESDEIISIDTRLVTIPVRVIDRKNRFVGGLTKENFSVFDNNFPQEIAHFQNEAQPFTVALVLDMSYSTVFKIGEIQSAAIAFIDQLRPEDKVIVISFDEEVHMLCEATSDRGTIYRAIRQTKISTGTSLYEAVDLTMNDRMRKITGRKAIVLFTDGVDTTSRKSHDLENLRDALELDALIYPIRYDTFADVQAMKNKSVVTPPNSVPRGTPPITPTSGKQPFPMPGPVIATPDNKGTTSAEYEHAREYLDKLALRTGGTMYEASSVFNLNNAFRHIASELREFYSIGYYPKDEPVPGKTRRIKVRVDQEKVAVRARESYVVAEKRIRN
ncbi:MAG: VWA domain-containing protein, partial [Blastocatellia bacterium]